MWWSDLGERMLGSFIVVSVLLGFLFWYLFWENVGNFKVDDSLEISEVGDGGEGDSGI